MCAGLFCMCNGLGGGLYNVRPKVSNVSRELSNVYPKVNSISRKLSNARPSKQRFPGTKQRMPQSKQRIVQTTQRCPSIQRFSGTKQRMPKSKQRITQTRQHSTNTKQKRSANPQRKCRRTSFSILLSSCHPYTLFSNQLTLSVVGKEDTFLQQVEIIDFMSSFLQREVALTSIG